MQSSPAGRTIEYVEGSPDEITERGNEVTALGEQMIESADTLERIKTRAIEEGTQKGKAIKALRDSIGDSYETLREAGELYQPVGPVIATYGEALADIQPAIQTAVDSCHELWTTYASLPGSVNPRSTLLLDDEAAQKQADEDEAKKDAYDAWRAQATQFDQHYDDWSDAFEAAADGIGDEMSGSIKDNFWDKWGGLITDILGWAALVVGIAALFFGGWVLVLAAALALAAFAATGIGYLNGDKSGMDLFLAGLAIIPAGKLTNMTKLVQFPRIARAGGLQNAMSRTWGALSKGPVHSLLKNWGKPATLHKNIGEKLFGQGYKSARRANIAMYIGNREALQGGLRSVRVLSAFDSAASVYSTFAGHAGRLNYLPGVDIELPSLPSGLSL